MFLNADNTMLELTSQSGAWSRKVSSIERPKPYQPFFPGMLTVPTECTPRGEESSQISMIPSVFVRVLLLKPSVTVFTDLLHLISSQ